MIERPRQSFGFFMQTSCRLALTLIAAGWLAACASTAPEAARQLADDGCYVTGSNVPKRSKDCAEAARKAGVQTGSQTLLREMEAGSVQRTGN
jgi:hypothetical protein